MHVNTEMCFPTNILISLESWKIQIFLIPINQINIIPYIHYFPSHFPSLQYSILHWNILVKINVYVSDIQIFSIPFYYYDMTDIYMYVYIDTWRDKVFLST